MGLKHAAIALLAASLALFAGRSPAEEEDHHVTAEARLDVIVDGNDTVRSVRYLWRMDRGFTGDLVDEFDADGNGRLDNSEIAEIGPVIRDSIAEYDYFQMVTRDGIDVPMAPPGQFIADIQDGQLIILFEMAPASVLPLSGKLAFGVYDPTFHTIFDVSDDSYLSVEPVPANCTRRVYRPDPDAQMARHEKQVARALSGDVVDNELIKAFATRLEIDCPPMADQ